MRKLMACLVALVATAVAANAAIITYSTRAAFDAATTGRTNIDFNGLAPAGGFTYFGDNLVTGGVSFTTPNPNLFVIDQGFSPPFWDWNSGGVLQSNFGGDITAALPGGKNAVGFEVLGGNDSTGWSRNYIVTLSTGDVFNYLAALQPGQTFVGFATTTGFITSVRIGDPVLGAPTIDNFVYGTAVVPEPLSIMVFGGVLAAGGLAVRRRVKATA